MTSWTFLTYHTRVLLCVAHDPGVRLRDIAASLNITERSAFGIVTDLVEAGYMVKEKNGRRNRYHIQAHLPLPEPDGRERTVGEILALLTGADLVGHRQADDVGVHALPSYALPARTVETRPRTSSTLSVTMECMDSSTSKA